MNKFSDHEIVKCTYYWDVRLNGKSVGLQANTKAEASKLLKESIK